MDLPTCPSCGQSVLDDDATDCPFCGAAMNGQKGQSQAAKPKTAQSSSAKPKAAPKTKSEPENDDPFAIKQAPTSAKVIPCAPKPMKGRLHRIVCPMCDTQGFIPQKAIGRQVKCANAKCLVPVFTAPGEDAETTPRAPARVSDEAASRKSDANAKKSGEKNSLMMYGIVGVILLAATLGLVFVLNKDAPTVLPPPPMPTFTNVDQDDPEDDIPVPVVDKPPVVAVGPDYRTEALGFVSSMIEAALQSNGNRDKSYCRRRTADAYLRLGMPEEAAQEFQQMQVVAAQEALERDYYQIEPLLRSYWTKIAAGGQAEATKLLDQVKPLAAKIPDSRGDAALGAGISLAAALANAGDIAAATELVTGLQGDLSVEDQQDTVRDAAWSSTAETLRDLGRPALPPMQVFAWNRPLVTAVAFDLAVHRRWGPAIAWANAQEDPQIASDTFSVIAAEMRAADSTMHRELATAATAKGPEVALRTYSALATISPTWMERATSAFTALPTETAVDLGSFDDVIDVAAPDLNSAFLSGTAATEYILAAHHSKNETAVAAGYQRLYNAMMSAVAPTPQLRKAAHDVGRNENRVQQQLAEELALRDERLIKTRFNSYRRGVDRLARSAESRRLALIQMLSRIVSAGAADTLETAMMTEGNGLKQEVMVDSLSGLLYVAAAGTGQDVSFAIKSDGVDRIPIARVDPVLEPSVVDSLVVACQQFAEGKLESAFAKIEVTPRLTGLRSATLNKLIESAAMSADSIEPLIAAVLRLRNLEWQEQAFNVMARIAVGNGQLKSAASALSAAPMKPSSHVAAFHGLVCGCVHKMKERPQHE